MTQRQLPSGCRLATSTVAPPPGSRVEVSAKSPFLITGCWPAEENRGRPDSARLFGDQC